MPEIVVNVWRPSGEFVGHSSLQLSNGTYISWWPEKECGPKNPRVKASPNDSLEDDIAAEGNRQPHAYKIKVSDDELRAIIRWWTGFKEKADYQFISNNCSTVAYYAQEAAFPCLTALNDEITVWTPGAVEMVAQDLAAGKRSFDKKRINEIKKAIEDEIKRLSRGSKKANRFKIGKKGSIK